jgi:xanthine/CO dehydrogenase XdhC/CoxF family maturation factor/CTP:molybdopterin cytidylyltransferase MocA
MMGTEYLHFLEALKAEKSLALATILRTSGSTPQVSGSTALFSPRGIISGTLGGGILEYEAERNAKHALETHQVRLMDFDLNADIHDQSGAICGGKATILIDAHPAKHQLIFLQVKHAFENRRTGALITTGKVTRGKEWELERYWIDQDELDQGLPEVFKVSKKSVIRSVHEGIPMLLIPGEKKMDQAEFNEFLFIDPVLPPERLIMVGGGHVGKALVQQAAMLDFDITLIDNRADAIERKILPPGTEVMIGAVGSELSKINVDPDTFIVIATQGHQHDAEALKACIRSQAGYIGLMGSQRKIRLMRERFIDEGWASAREFDAVHAPVGLNIQSETVHEIVVSIAAELIKVRKELREKRKIPFIYGLVLAAGESKRMKQQKLLMDYHGESFIRSIVRKVSISDVDQTLVVLGSHSNEVYEEIQSFHVDSVFNPLFKEGMLSSIQCGFNSIPKKVDAVVLFLGDQPMVETDVINQLVESYMKTREKIIIPVYQGERGHPVLIDVSLREEIMTLNPGKGLRELMYSHPDEVYELEVDSRSILKDIDNIKDYNIEIT